MNEQAIKLLLEQGERAFMQGQRRDECPYLGSAERQVWGQGWDRAAARGAEAGVFRG